MVGLEPGHVLLLEMNVHVNPVPVLLVDEHEEVLEYQGRGPDPLGLAPPEVGVVDGHSAEAGEGAGEQRTGREPGRGLLHGVQEVSVVLDLLQIVGVDFGDLLSHVRHEGVAVGVVQNFLRGNCECAPVVVSECVFRDWWLQS